MAEPVLQRVTADEGGLDASCDVQFLHVFKVLGKRWNGMIIVALMQQPARFSELAKKIPGITDSILVGRLRELMAANLVERRLAEGESTAVLYRLTPLGEDLRPAFLELRAWAARNGIENCRP
ncbi:helix-turn-helix domain-containing protein [Thermopolyspora sp. NPDC052614]|uniref:winged helix-turn-helix transcriptional regulator n=1 Tax=Thermopolyspora sp. NPDC052614 TaxID=3155682 RepID=UPI00342047E4